MPLGNRVDGIHFAADACIMHGNDGACLFGNGVFNQLFVDVHCVGADVHEHALGSAHGKCVCGGDECERGHNDFVAGLDIAKQCRHFECVCATRGEQSACAVCFLLQPGMAFLVELTVTANASAFDGLLYVSDFWPDKRWLIKRYFHCSSLFPRASNGCCCIA